MGLESARSGGNEFRRALRHSPLRPIVGLKARRASASRWLAARRRSNVGSELKRELERAARELPPGVFQEVNGLHLMAAPLGTLDTTFAIGMGFELALSTQIDILASSSWTTLCERVKQKDRPGSQALLVMRVAGLRRIVIPYRPPSG
jgi:hypothetical protein